MRASTLSVVLLLAIPAVAAAQGPAPVLVAPVTGASVVRGSCSTGATVQVTVKTGATTVTLSAPCTDGTFAADISALMLKVGSELSATQSVGAQKSNATTAKVTANGPFGDVRDDFEASAFAGFAFDTLATQEINQYLNPEDNGNTNVRGAFGFNFQYRLAADTNRDKAPQIWLYGKAQHSVRSEDLECGEAPRVPSCAKEIAQAGGHIPDDALFMLRSARSLEVSFGGRAELVNLNLPGRNPARIYVKGELAFVNLAGSDGDGKELRQIAGGATVVGGPRTGSYFEVGFGRNDLFQLNRYRRFKLDGMLQQSLKPGVNLFAQFVSDVDFKDGSDSIQSFFGLSFDLGRLVGTPTTRAGK